MSHLLHIDSSLRTEGSRSRKLSAYYAERWQARHPDGTVTYRDLAADPIPHLDHVAFSAGFIAPADRTPEQAAASALTDQLVDEVLAADTILIGMPLYNFGPPSTFKAWFDRIVSERTSGKLGDKEFVIVTARGGGYRPGTPREGWDHREPWLRHALTTLGVNDAGLHRHRADPRARVSDDDPARPGGRRGPEPGRRPRRHRRPGRRRTSVRTPKRSARVTG